MQLSNFSYAVWLLSTGLAILVCALAYRRGLYHGLPFFTAYLTVEVASTCIAWAVYREFGYGSLIAYNAGWILLAMALVARGFAIAELCGCLLRAYPGIWALAWRILLCVLCVFLLHAVIESAAHHFWLDTFVLALDRDLELTATGILISVLVIGRYYELELDPVERWIAVGLCIYSAAHVMTNAVMVQDVATHLPEWFGYHDWVAQAQTLWNSAREFAADCAMILWTVALWRPLPAARPAPAMLPASVYRELSPAVNYRLRLLNDRLLELLKQ